jgi:hypothetical protein
LDALEVPLLLHDLLPRPERWLRLRRQRHALSVAAARFGKRLMFSLLKTAAVSNGYAGLQYL